MTNKSKQPTVDLLVAYRMQQRLSWPKLSRLMADRGFTCPARTLQNVCNTAVRPKDITWHHIEGFAKTVEREQQQQDARERARVRAATKRAAVKTERVISRQRRVAV